MFINRNNIIRHLRDVVIVTVIGIFISVLFGGWNSVSSLDNFLYSALYSFLIGVSLWKGNQYLGYKINKKNLWRKTPAKALIINLTALVVYSLITIVVINLLWYKFYFDKDFKNFFSQGSDTIIIEIGITFIIALSIYSSIFFKYWRKALVNEENLKREALALEYEALKNQVNPHFLFNTLNTLSSLVHKDPDLSEKFIKQLSEVYRYVLEQKDKEIVSLSTELKFVESYIYLQKIRYGNNLKVEINIFENKNKMIIPLSLQMLVENAIKHNIISEEKPLYINISSENDDYIVVKNNLQKKTVIKSMGNMGLKNIKSRYEFLTDKTVFIENNSKYFIVKIPLLNTDKHYI